MRATSRFLLWPVMGLCWLPAKVQGQWSAAVEVAADRFWGGSIETAGNDLSFRPYRPTTFGATVARRSRRVGVAIRLGYTEAGLALEGREAAVVAKGAFTILSLTPEISYRIASVGAGNSLRLQGGPLFELWDIIDEGSRTRIGGQAAVVLAVPLSRRLGATISAGAALIPSPFDEGELLDGYERRALWRRRVSGGLEYGF